MQCVRIIYGYMGFATFLIFFAMTGGILVDLAQTLGWHFDAITVVFALANFACVGSTILFFQPAPLALKQARCPARVAGTAVCCCGRAAASQTDRNPTARVLAHTRQAATGLGV